ncbi:MAG: outer membrane beta-barrel protein, partial [Muribaculaceae bacterium]|nr:outer membrane beta-barrel protein [Muribaculaceae bacterium]
MKKIIIAALLLAATATAATAQRAGEFDLSASRGDIADYNRVSLSYDNTSYHNNWGESDENFSLNGFGLNYIHGFKLSSSMPMYLEAGASLSYSFGTPYEDKYYDEKQSLRNLNIQVPVNYTYHLPVADNFTIAPYAGINFKIHLLTDGRYEEDGEKSDWYSFFSKDDVGEDDTWNRFQMGWQVGVNFQYSGITLGVQYGTDFITAYSYK